MAIIIVYDHRNIIRPQKNVVIKYKTNNIRYILNDINLWKA